MGGNKKEIEKFKGILTSTKARSLHNKLSSCWSEESDLTQKILISILYYLENPPNISLLLKRISKLENDVDYYIKEYPDQLRKLEEKDNKIR